MFLGPVAGFTTMALYLLEGAVGLPVFTPYSAAGAAHLLGPNGGFLFSYPLAAAIAGWIVRTAQPVTSRFRVAVLAAAVATVPIFLFGACWFAFYAHHNLSATWGSPSLRSSQERLLNYSRRRHLQQPSAMAKILKKKL